MSASCCREVVAESNSRTSFARFLIAHLLGAASYMRLAEVKQLPYQTTFLGGLDLDVGGTVVYGGLWAVATIGFIASAAAMLMGRAWWKPALVGVTLLSLVLTTLVWSDAPIGVIVNLVILAVLWLGPLFGERLHPCAYISSGA